MCNDGVPNTVKSLHDHITETPIFLLHGQDTLHHTVLGENETVAQTRVEETRQFVKCTFPLGDQLILTVAIRQSLYH